MNAAEALVFVSARRLPGSDGCASVTLLPQVEVGLAHDNTDAALRRAWQQRQAGRATPVLVIADAETTGLVRVLGPSDARAAIREVPVDRLAELPD